MNNLFSLDNKKVLITGASRGIGFLLARGLAECGAHILVNATTEENAQRAVEALRREGFRADAAAFDVTDSQAIHAAIEKVEAQSGGIDVLINNAGIQRRHPFTEFPEKDWDDIIAVNQKAVFMVSQAVARHMVQRQSGKIINIGSMQSELGRDTITPYAASKGAVKMLTRGMCVELARYNIQVNGIAPGYFKTEMTQALADNPEFTVTRRFIFLEEGDVVEMTRRTVNIFDKQGNAVERPEIESQVQYDAGDKGAYRHYMQKEIYEQPLALKNTLEGRFSHGQINLSELGPRADELLAKVQHVQIIACGTSYHSGMVARYWFESLAGVPCDVEIASEFRYRKSAVRPGSLIITLSQSGETADTLAALRLSKELGYLGSLAVCNVAGSSLVRESDLALMTKAGTEIGVASTKAFTTQLAVLLMLVARLGRLKGMAESVEHEIVHGLQALPARIEQMLSMDKEIEALAEGFSDKHHALFLGRGDQYPIAMEGALKLKEISYIHAEAYAAGELKHGPLALIDADMPVIVVAPNNELLEKLKSNIEEVRARGGQLYVFADQDAGFVSSEGMTIIPLPHVEEIVAPIFYTVPLQLLSYHVALIKGTDVDQPRNLAKSVTVE